MPAPLRSQQQNKRRTSRSGPEPTPVSRNSSQGPWEILLAGDLNERHVDLLQELMEVPARSKGTIYFDSNGGSVYTALALVTLLQVRQLRATAIVLGECSSAALLPFAACEKRFVPAYSTHLFHPMKWESEENVRLEEAAEWARHFQLIQDLFDERLAQLFGLSRETLDQWSIPGKFLSGKDLIAHGLAQPIELATPAAVPHSSVKSR